MSTSGIVVLVFILLLFALAVYLIWLKHYQQKLKTMEWKEKISACKTKEEALVLKKSVENDILNNVPDKECYFWNPRFSLDIINMYLNEKQWL